MSREKVIPFDRPPDPPAPDGLLLSPKDPRASARAWLHAEQRVDRLWFTDSVFYAWDGGAYRVMSGAELKSLIASFLDRAKKNTNQGFGPFAPTATDINEVYTALQHLQFMEAKAPSWLESRPWAITDCVLCQNGILHIPTRTLAPLTPQFFSLNPLDFAYDTAAPEPIAWLGFLDSLLPDDPVPIALLQEWMGLMLTPETRYHKMLLIQGPPRCGKGTIARVLQRLVGLRNVCSPKLGNFGRQFGQAVLIDKTVAIFADAKISGRTDTGEIVENLLSISGEDTQTIPRKGLSDWIGTLRVRFTILTNKLPRMEDDSGALLSRFLPLVLTESFVGREDLGLADRLTAELPGILMWALAGADRLRTRGRFLDDAHQQDIRNDIEELNSPVTVFVRDCCDLTDDAVLTARSDVFAAYVRWCTKQGRDKPGIEASFASALYAAWPSTRCANRLGPREDRIRVFRGITVKAGH